MKKEFKIVCRVLTTNSQDILTTSATGSGYQTENLTAPARTATPTTVNGVLGQVADQK